MLKFDRCGRGLGLLTGALSLIAGCSSNPGAGEGSFSSTSSATFDGTAETTSAEAGTGDGGFSWTPVDEYELRIDDAVPPPLNLAMNRQEVSDLFGSVAEDILLLELDAEPLLVNTLDEIKGACGTDWMNDTPDPVYDCALTALGQSFVGPDGTWRTSAEFSAIRILTMTPANSRVVGTSIEGVQELADLLNLGGGFPQILADTLEIARTREFLDTAALSAALEQNVLGTHPNIGPGGTLPMTLADALADLAPMGTKYGPIGNHPGVLDPSFTVHGEVFGPNFQMTAEAASNLKVLDGADMSVGKDYVTVVQDLLGPTFDDPAEFDFENPATFAITGLNDTPTVDLRFRVIEHDAFVNSCVGNTECVNNLPGNPVGTGTVWGVNPWALEYQIATAGMLTYDSLQHQQCYPFDLICTAEILVGQDPFPLGWSQFSTLLGLGSPPQDQYVWELLMEVAQVQFHDNGFVVLPEGEGDVSFTLHDIAVGITGAEAAEAVRPFLQAQAASIADFLLGDYKKNNGDVDFYFRRAEDSKPYLYFVTQEDLAEGKSYGWQTPGFFASPDLDLANKLSAQVISGLADTSHEKWAPPPGVSTAYLQDDIGDLYRLTFTVPETGDPSTISVAIDRSAP